MHNNSCAPLPPSLPHTPHTIIPPTVGLVAAQGFSLFNKKPAVSVPDPNQVADAEEQAIARLKALKFSSSHSQQEQQQQENTNDNASNSNSNSNSNSIRDDNDKNRKLRVSKGKGNKGIEGLMNVVVAGSSSNPLPPDDNINTDTKTDNNNNANNANNNNEWYSNSNNNNHDSNIAFDARNAPSIDSDSAATTGQKVEAADPAANQKVLSPPTLSSSTSTSSSISSVKKKKKIMTGHEDDIIHEHDHADNDAYDDIIWYNGPHRDDEDEHGDDHHHDDDHHDDEHHDEDIHFDEDYHHDDEGHEDDESKNNNQDDRQTKQDHVEASNDNDDDQEHQNRVRRGSTRAEPLDTTYDMNNNINQQQRILNNNDSPSSTPSAQQNQHDHSTGTGTEGGDPTVFHHSGAEVLVGSIAPVEFCLRLKHECESTCREFRSQVLHVSTTCAFGSVAELLLWGKCCQVGLVNRKKSSSGRVRHQQWQESIALQDSTLPSSPDSSSATEGSTVSEERQEELAQEHLQLQQKRHAAQLQHEKQLFLQQQLQNK
ncbi:hypothetical protein BGZ96_002603 [Linnemannia gamsii]|uniref:Uncharacterized protein n=1 Tax=Linnemannia gamsii TaxID=64522 RepID=A0ABQ7KG06_9FUNG|nr:hypothetical protein BGZ96_002603 [Linnemannia gamsii]